MHAASIELSHVTRRYGDVVAVDDVSFTIAAGTLVTLLGPSGCGKTTVLRLIAGLEAPTIGTVAIGGVDVTHVPAPSRDVSMVFQSYALFPHMSVRDNVGYGLTVAKRPRDEVDARVRAALALISLEGLGDRLPSELSGGQQQRVAVARALVLEPSVLLFDEPLSNLDARLRRQMRDEIRELQQRLGLTVVYVTHDQSEALAVSDRIIVMNRAAIAQQGTPRELYSHPADAFVATFIGEANRAAATLRRRDDGLADVSLGPLSLALEHRGQRDGAIAVAIRPEAIELCESGATPLAGTIAKAVYLGSVMEYTIDTPVGELFAVDHHVERPRAAGDSVSIALAPHGVVVLPAV
jgi:iron(III) transport system ATP-binding protein